MTEEVVETKKLLCFGPQMGQELINTSTAEESARYATPNYELEDTPMDVVALYTIDAGP